MSTGTHIQTKKTENVAAFLVDDLPGDDRNVLISVSGFSSDTFSRVEKMDVYSGRRTPVAHGPVRNADYVTDSKGIVRFSYGHDLDNNNKLFYRTGVSDGWSQAEWTLINDEKASNHVEIPLGFAQNDSIAYIKVEQPQGPDAIVAFDAVTHARTQVFRDDDTDPAATIRDRVTSAQRQPVGVFVPDGITRTAFFDPSSSEARLYRSLEAAFAGSSVEITSKTRDGRIALVQVWSDRNPGDFYLFDTVEKKADRILGRRDWVSPEAMSAMQPFTNDRRWCW